ncbi:hypothetical protein [Mycolicibacterium thermoresistibile]
MAVAGLFLLTSVLFGVALGGLLTGVAVSRRRRRRRGPFLVGFCCGWVTAPVTRGRRQFVARAARRVISVGK